MFHPTKPRLHALEAVLHACEASLKLLQALLDTERTVMHFILAADKRMELVVRAHSQGALGIALDADEDIIFIHQVKGQLQIGGDETP